MELLDPINGQQAIVNWAILSNNKEVMLCGVTYLTGLQSGGSNCLNLVKSGDKWTVLPTRITMEPDQLQQLIEERR